MDSELPIKGPKSLAMSFQNLVAIVFEGGLLTYSKNKA
jgi:hypothetical protein